MTPLAVVCLCPIESKLSVKARCKASANPLLPQKPPPAPPLQRTPARDVKNASCLIVACNSCARLQCSPKRPRGSFSWNELNPYTHPFTPTRREPTNQLCVNRRKTPLNYKSHPMLKTSVSRPCQESRSGRRLGNNSGKSLGKQPQAENCVSL